MILTDLNLTLRVVLSILVALVGLGIGLWLRRRLVRRLQKTVLDDWLVHTLGLLVVLPPLLIAAGASSGIVTASLDQLNEFLRLLVQDLRTKDVPGLVANLLWTLLIVVFAIGSARTLAKLTMRGLGESRLDANLRVLITRIAYVLVLVVAAFWVLSLWQVAITLPVAVLGTLTVAFTFSVQDILKDLVAGLYILLERPFFIGDQICIDKYIGKVVNVELRATRLRLVSGEEITVPNALVFGGIVINNSRYAERRATIVITLPLEDFAREETPELIIRRMHELEAVMAIPEPEIAVSGIRGEEVELTLRFWIITGQLAAVTDVMYALRTLLPAADLSVKETGGNV